MNHKIHPKKIQNRKTISRDVADNWTVTPKGAEILLWLNVGIAQDSGRGGNGGGWGGGGGLEGGRTIDWINGKGRGARCYFYKKV